VAWIIGDLHTIPAVQSHPCTSLESQSYFSLTDMYMHFTASLCPRLLFQMFDTSPYLSSRFSYIQQVVICSLYFTEVSVRSGTVNSVAMIYIMLPLCSYGIAWQRNPSVQQEMVPNRKFWMISSNLGSRL
jgi:hypothetical protein